MREAPCVQVCQGAPVKVLDTYQGHGIVTGTRIRAWRAAGFERVILKLYDPANYVWTKMAIYACQHEAFPFDVYSTGGGRHEPRATWAEAKRIMHALGLDPQAQGVAIDWWEFLMGAGVNMGWARTILLRGVTDAHGDNCKVIGYGSDHFGWDNYGGIPFDAAWVAAPYTPTAHHNDLHQYGSDAEGDLDTTTLTNAEWVKLVTGPRTPPPPPNGGTMLDDSDAAQLGYATLKDWRAQEERSKAVADVLAGRPKRTGQDPAYDAQYDATAAKLP